ncbi:MAG: CPBP family intramembrane metalloprotease [Anaerolineae bacterium]|nr:CPBP family intramembrane metalloprotease [Anaerolineae bacterium]
MNKLTHWIKSHQVIAFFIVTFAISWGLGFTYDAVMNKGVFLLAPLAFIATCGPALAGIIVSAICNTQPKQGTKRAYWIAFLVAWVVSTFAFLANNTAINHAPLSPVMVGFTIVSVVPVAFVISMAYSRIPAVKRYLVSLIRPRGVWGWSLLALVLQVGLVLLSIPVSSLLGRQPIAAHRFPETGLTLIGLIAVKFLYQFFFFNATGEEAGWRGFALPRMQSSTSPLVACLVMNLFWPLWHLFAWKAEGRPVFSPEYWVQTYLELLPATVTLGWFYNRSKGSILVAGIAHAAGNATFAFFPNLDWTVFTVTVAAAALVMILVDRMWKKLPADHPAVYHTWHDPAAVDIPTHLRREEPI